MMFFNKLIAASLFLASGSLARFYGSSDFQLSLLSSASWSSTTTTPSVPSSVMMSSMVMSSAVMTSTVMSSAVMSSAVMSSAVMSSAVMSSAVMSSAVMSSAVVSSAVAAQTSSSSSCSAPQVMASPPPNTVSVQVVQVSNSNGSSLTYYPEQIQAAPGSMVQFQFYPKVRSKSFP